MPTYSAMVAGGLPRGGGSQQHHQQSGHGLQQHHNGVKQTPVRQMVGFAVAKNTDRLGFVGNVLIGYKVEVQVTSGMVYEGVFSSYQNDSTGAFFTLKYAKTIKDPNSSADRNALAEKPVPAITIPATDLVQLFAKDVRLSAEDLSGVDHGDVGFETDAAISRGRGGCVRELQPWKPDEGDDGAFFSLESSNNTTNWDQFAVNRDRFGVQTTWNEHFYTTKINPDECRISEAEALRIAHEIETGNTTSTTNIHLLEERGGELAPDVDEEALYGAVIREAAPPPYQHPNSHHYQQHQSQQSQRQQQRNRASQQSSSAADRVSAWGRAGSGVAAVAGSLSAIQALQQMHHQQQKQQQHQHQQRGAMSGGGVTAAKSASVPVPVPPASASAGGAAPTQDGASGSGSTPGSTAPIDIDPRKEVNKVRSSLTTWPKKDRSSPYGTPRIGMSRSPVFASPLVADPVSFSALDLDPGAPQVRLDPEAQAEFLRFKEEQMKKRSGQMGAEATLADLKKAASSSFKERAGPPSGNGMVGTPAEQTSAAPGTAAVPTTTEFPSPAAASVAPLAAASPAAAATAAPAAAPAVAAAAAGSATGAAAATPATAAAPATPASATEAEEPKPKLVSKLNPNAKPFSLNIYAKEFVPRKPAATPAAAPAPPAIQPAIPAVSSAAAAAPAPSTASAVPAAPAAAAAAAAVAVSAAAAAAIASTAPPAASHTAAAPPAAAAAAAQAATTALSSGQATYLPSASVHGLTVTYHHTSSAHSHSHGGPQPNQYGYGGQGGVHVSHGHANVHHERGGYGGGGGGLLGRELREHGGGMHYRGDSYRSGADGMGGGGGGGGYRGGGGGGGDPFRTGGASGSGDGYQHHHHHHHHHKGAGGGDHHMVKGADVHGGAAQGGLHKVPPPPPQGPAGLGEGPMGTAVIVNGVAPAALGPHVLGAMTPMSAAGMTPMGYGVMVASPGGYMTASSMPPGTVAIPTTTGGHMPIIGYMSRTATGAPTVAMAPGLMMSTAPPGMAPPYGHAGVPYMTAGPPPGSMPPPSPTGRPPSTSYYQTGAYPTMLAQPHPGAPHAHAGHPMTGQPGGPMPGHHLMQGPGGHAHAHGPGHLAQHIQDSRGPGPMGPGGGKGGGRQGGRPPRMDHDRSVQVQRGDMD